MADNFPVGYRLWAWLAVMAFACLRRHWCSPSRDEMIEHRYSLGQVRFGTLSGHLALDA